MKSFFHLINHLVGARLEMEVDIFTFSPASSVLVVTDGGGRHTGVKMFKFTCWSITDTTMIWWGNIMDS